MSKGFLTLVDSSLWIEALRVSGEEQSRDRVAELLQNGEAAWCEVVALELWHGARGKKEREVLSEFQRTLPMLEIDDAVWRKARSLAMLARDNGLTSPSVDIIIAACGFRHGVKIAHKDKHLSALEKLREHC